MDDSVSLMVAASERFSRRWSIEVEWDFKRGVKVRYFFESVAMRTLPVVDSFAGKWWLKTGGTCRSVTSNS